MTSVCFTIWMVQKECNIFWNLIYRMVTKGLVSSLHFIFKKIIWFLLLEFRCGSYFSQTPIMSAIFEGSTLSGAFLKYFTIKKLFWLCEYSTVLLFQSLFDISNFTKTCQDNIFRNSFLDTFFDSSNFWKSAF